METDRIGLVADQMERMVFAAVQRQNNENQRKDDPGRTQGDIIDDLVRHLSRGICEAIEANNRQLLMDLRSTIK